MKIVIRFLLIGSWVFLLTGCLAGASKPQKQYLFSMNYPQVSQPAKDIKKTVSLTPLNVAPQFNTTEFVYRISEFQYLNDYYHTFMVPANQQITTISVGYLSQRGLLAYVGANPKQSTPASYNVVGAVTELYADYRKPAHPTAVMTIHYAVLYNNDQGIKRILMNKTYHQVIPLQAKTTEALMSAWNVALSNIMNQLSHDVRSVCLI